MDIETIKQVAEDRIISDLCVKWYILDNAELLRGLCEEEIKEKEKIYNEIQNFYRKINNK